MSLTSEGVGDARAAAPTKSLSEKSHEFDGMVAKILSQQSGATSDWSATSPATIEGLFPCEVHVHFQGEPKIAALRGDPKVSVLDLTSLATLLTLTALVEATTRGQVTKVQSTRMVSAIEGLQLFTSPQFEENSALMTIWPGCRTDKDKKGTTCDLKTASENIEKGGGSIKPYSILQAAAKDCKTCTVGKETLSSIEKNKLCKNAFDASLADFAKLHNFPPDVTSSFANLAFGALLRKGGKSYSAAFQVWENANKNYSLLTKHASTFAYKPSAEDVNVNIIDSRTYHNLAGYLGNASLSEMIQNAHLLTNWIPQTSKDGRLEYGASVLPQFNCVDLFGTATFLHAVTLSILQNMALSDDSSLMNLYRSNLDLVIWILTNENNDTLEMMMTSHPSVYQFYWQLARVISEAEQARLQNVTHYKKLEEFHDKYKLIRSRVTTAILTAVQDGGLNAADGRPLAYADDFLGASDVDEQGKAKPSGSDRLFSTATAVNCLLSAWTTDGGGNKLKYLNDTPDDVKLAVTRLVNFVIIYANTGGVSLMNAFYSRVDKHCDNLRYWFPSNKIVTRDGKDFTGSDPSPEVLFGMRGTVTTDEYRKMLEETRFEHKLPQSMPVMSNPAAIFMFWSSPAYTQAVSLLAMAQASNLMSKKS